ncbi:MAG: hypothetical protein HYU97_07050 [Deltaproteobacteria bacterium]|nr:hypothetical protein [Deltaproteobacteria bacterium]
MINIFSGIPRSITTAYYEFFHTRNDPRDYVSKGGEVTHHGDPLWAFASDYYTENPYRRFKMLDDTHSERTYCVGDVDAVYFENGIEIFEGTTCVYQDNGSGVIQFSDLYDVHTFYQRGHLIITYVEPWLLGLFTKAPHRVLPNDDVFYIFNLDQWIATPNCADR